MDPQFAKLLKMFVRVDVVKEYAKVNKGAPARSRAIVSGRAKHVPKPLVRAFYKQDIPAHMVFPLYALYKQGRLLGLIWAEYTTGVYLRFATYKGTAKGAALIRIRTLGGLYDGGVFHTFKLSPGMIRIWKKKIGVKNPLESDDIKF